ncbi:MAG: TPM domain-containing protein [Planctomycetota bacterium]
MNKRVIGIVILVLALSAGAWAAEPSTPPAEGEAQGQAAKDYAPFPQPDSGYVTDTADLLTREEEEEIEQWLWRVESRTEVEIIVVTIGSIKDYPDTPNNNIEEFATALFNKYGIGNKPKNDGVLLLVAKKDRKARIELGAGYGRRRDADAERIMQKKIVPEFKKEDYAAGITEGVKAIMLEFAGVRIGLNWPLIIAIAAIPILGAIAYSLFKHGKRGWGWVCVGLIVVLVMAIVWTLWKTAKHMPKGSSGGWSAGGLGGFGGGSSGGGGATGSW